MLPYRYMNPDNMNMINEALRQRANLGGSSAGIGADTANSPDVGNPLAQAGMTPPPTDGSMGNQSTPTTNGLKQQKGEAQILVNALKQRLNILSKRGE